MAKTVNKKLPEFNICKICDYSTYNKYDFKKHTLTARHKKRSELIASNPLIVDNLITNALVHIPPTNNNNNNSNNNKKHTCKCGRIYMHHSSLCKHRKICETQQSHSSTDLNKLVMNLITENKELKQTLVTQNFEMHKTITELIPKIGDNNYNTINTKNKFNINVFLNEQCKDAISMNEFVDKIEISMKNLLTTKDRGIGEGVSNIIIDNMNKLSLYERPMHCTDTKRETLYIKNDEWEKDDNMKQVNILLKRVENKQMKNINKWVEEHPNYMDNETQQNEYLNLLKECTSSIENHKERVIKKLCDNITITDKKT